jgi:hypothetical protein
LESDKPTLLSPQSAGSEVNRTAIVSGDLLERFRLSSRLNFFFRDTVLHNVKSLTISIKI